MKKKSIFKRKKKINWKKVKKRFASFVSKPLNLFFRRYSRISGKVKRQVFISRMKEADIILANPKIIRLSIFALFYRLFLRSQYVHSMLYIGNEQIIHTTAKDGVVIDKVPRKIFKRDRYSVFRVKALNDEERKRIVKEALKFKGKKLDHLGLITNVPSKLLGFKKPFLKLAKDRLWCSKLIYESFLADGIELVQPDKAENITSEDLSRSALLDKI